MTLFSITDTSDYLNELLSGETSGTVHSVYRKTISDMYAELMAKKLIYWWNTGSLTGKGLTHLANQSDYNIDFRKNGEP